VLSGTKPQHRQPGLDGHAFMRMSDPAEGCAGMHPLKCRTQLIEARNQGEIFAGLMVREVGVQSLHRARWLGSS
jgi:hypothetical protein